MCLPNEMDKEFVTFRSVYTHEQIRSIESEFQRFKNPSTVYLDHAGATLYSEKQIVDALNDLTINIYGNPHAKNSSSKLTEDAVDKIRYDILDFFNTTDEEYSVIFTSGATASLKLIAESFQYGKSGGTFAYLLDNHTSVLGMREFAKRIKPLAIGETFDLFNKSTCHENEQKPPPLQNNLFAYPAQSNFSGCKYPLEWVEKVQSCLQKVAFGQWYCVLDAASYVSTSALNLSTHKPDFVPISFYKIFGYPTGLGALLIKNSSAHILSKTYFGGGTVFLATSSENIVHRRKVLHERFEDGTLPFLEIVSLRHGFECLRRLKLNMDLISKHVFNLAKFVYNNLRAMHHANGQPVVVLYSNTLYESIHEQGGIVNFNLLRSNGDFVGFTEVLNIANLYNIQLRTGCFCNPGACQSHLGLSNEDVKYQFSQGHVCGDQNDLIDGTPTGSVRVSFGYMSTKSDADKLLELILNNFVDKPALFIPVAATCLTRRLNKTQIYDQCDPVRRVNCIKEIPSKLKNNEALKVNFEIVEELNAADIQNNVGILKEIHLYPVKSCGAFSVKRWRLISTGLQYDRQWMIVNAAGVCLTQKKYPSMCMIKPEIDIDEGLLSLHFDELSAIQIPLDPNSCKDSFPFQSKVCGDRIDGWDCGDCVSSWLCEALNVDGLRLIRQLSPEENQNVDTRISKKERNLKLSLSNQAQFLLINSTSVEWLLNQLKNEEIANLESLNKRFRPNFVVSLPDVFAENAYKQLRIGDVLLMNDGPCTRCQMICINQDTGEKSTELLMTLSKEFMGKVTFGTYLKFNNKNICDFVEIGCNVYVP